jgi:hypothetical protein
MVVRRRIDDHKSDWDQIEKWSGLRRLCEIVANVKHDLVRARRERLSLQKRSVGSTISIRVRAGEQCPLLSDAVEFDAHSRGRAAVGGIEYVSG